MSPLIDCIFLLLIFFMLSSTFLTPALRLDLPKVDSQSPTASAEVIVTIDADGKVFVNTDEVSMEGLGEALRRSVASMDKPSVTVRGDKDMRYSLFVQALDTIRACGIVDVRVAHVRSR